MPDHSIKAKRDAWQRAKKAADALRLPRSEKGKQMRRMELLARSGFYLVGFAARNPSSRSARRGCISNDTSKKGTKESVSSGAFFMH